MKQITCFLFAMLSLGTANAQVAQWLVPPEYDDIEVLPDCNLIMAQQGFERHVWDMNSNCLAKVSDDLYTFSEGYAVSTRPETAYVTAIYDTTGKKTTITDQNVQLGWGYPFFHDGFLLISDGNYFYFMDTEGGVEPKAYYQAYPFSHGYAACFTFANLHKMKDPVNYLIDVEMEPLELGYGGKMFPADDIDFISSVGDDGTGFVVYKEKLYYFDAATAELSPVLPLDGDANIKNQARIDGDITKALVKVDENTKSLRGKCGKNSLTINFDAITLKPLNMTIGEEERVYQKKIVTQTSASTTLKEVKDLISGKYALHLGYAEVLPPQFDKVNHLEGNTALVTMNDKLGLLRINPNDKFVFKINENEGIGFRHKYFYTTVRLDMPAYIHAEETSFEIDPESGCYVDKLTKEAKNNPDGSYVEYKCRLECPITVSDDVRPIIYPVNIVYQGLRTPPMEVRGQVWHSKYFAVDVNEKDVSLSGSTLTFIVNIRAERQPGEPAYPFFPKLTTENLEYSMEKIMDTSYKCVVKDLKQGINIITVRVEEDGCPPADYAFEVVYTPRVEQGKNKVTMTKKKTPTIPVLQY